MNRQFYIGGYQKTDCKCLHLCEYTGSNLRIIESYGVSNASYLCMSNDRKNLYAVLETDTFKGQKGGGVAAFVVEPDGSLTLLNTAPSEGAHPCHLSVCSQNRRLYVANYSGGSTIIYNLQDDGSIGAKKRLLDHNTFGKPSGVAGRRQDSPHAHYIQCRNDNTLWVCDLGLDMVLVLDPDGNELTKLPMPGGFGPRHVDFHPSLPMAYVLGEMGQAVIPIKYDGLKLEAGPAIPVSPGAEVSCAAIRVAPGGKLLLTSNRADISSLSVLSLDAGGGITGLSSIYETKGKCPRDFVFSPEGNEVLVAYQDSDFIEILTWSDDGKLTPKSLELAVQKPTCILF